jgi:hypothetical protein
MGLSTSAKAETCSVLTTPAEAKAQLMAQILFAPNPAQPHEVPQCTFCNLTGYSTCDLQQGQSCGLEGATRRCYVPPACACEWGICTCRNGSWNCVY